MKFRLNLAVFFGLFVFIAFSGISFAGTLELKKIGNLDLAGQKYPEWWYTGTRPLLVGSAEDSTDVTIKAGTDTFTTQADVNGDWTYRLLLDAGVYDIILTSEDETYAFKLHLGEEFPGDSTQTSSTTSAVPSTGINQTTALTLGVGVSLLALYLYFYESNKKHRAFERKIVSDQ